MVSFRTSYNIIKAMSPYQRYAIPFIGNTFRGLDQYADYQRMYADYQRNVGRTILYPSVRDYRSQAATAHSQAISNGIKHGLKTYRNAMDLIL